MKHYGSILLLLMVFSLSVSAQSVYDLIPRESQLGWKGTDALGGGHSGTLQIASGSLLLNARNEITKGDFIIDMNAMDTDIRPKEQGRGLEDHLKSDDFFSVARFPKAFFSIVKVASSATILQPDQYMVTGYLSIKGITNLITFPATITITKNVANAKAEITIDRTKWDITYKSRTFLSTVKDGIISDEIRISLNLLFRSSNRQ